MAQTTLKQVIDFIQYFATGTTGVTAIQTVNFGDTDKVASGTIVYPFWRLNYLNTKIEDKWIYHNFQIIVADSNEGEDEANLPVVYSKLASIFHQFQYYLTNRSSLRNVMFTEPDFKFYRTAPFFLDGKPNLALDLTVRVHNYLCATDVNLEGGLA